jgi:hypothetical protein
LAISQFDWPITKKSWNYGGSPKIEYSMESWSVSPFAPPIQVRRGGLWAKHMGLKWGAIGNTLGGTCWEPWEHIGNKIDLTIGNMMEPYRAHWKYWISKIPFDPSSSISYFNFCWFEVVEPLWNSLSLEVLLSVPNEVTISSLKEPSNNRFFDK